jgi:hypothetical protein
VVPRLCGRCMVGFVRSSGQPSPASGISDRPSACSMRARPNTGTNTFYQRWQTGLVVVDEPEWPSTSSAAKKRRGPVAGRATVLVPTRTAEAPAPPQGNFITFAGPIFAHLLGNLVAAFFPIALVSFTRAERRTHLRRPVFVTDLGPADHGLPYELHHTVGTISRPPSSIDPAIRRSFFKANGSLALGSQYLARRHKRPWRPIRPIDGQRHHLRTPRHRRWPPSPWAAIPLAPGSSFKKPSGGHCG